MLFSWKKNRTKEKNFFNKNNDDLLKELKEKGIVDKNILNMPDNITVMPWGDLLISEDGKGFDRLIILKQNGDSYTFAKNVYNKSEFAGATFFDDGNILFVNIYNPTMTFAIEGPWASIK